MLFYALFPENSDWPDRSDGADKEGERRGLRR
nr:MAG TPA: hypothetical protein [Caudoviricetes sp.]